MSLIMEGKSTSSTIGNPKEIVRVQIPQKKNQKTPNLTNKTNMGIEVPFKENTRGTHFPPLNQPHERCLIVNSKYHLFHR